MFVYVLAYTCTYYVMYVCVLLFTQSFIYVIMYTCSCVVID